MSGNFLCIYTDESLGDRFCALCAISGPCDNLKELEDKLREVVKQKRISELKFSEVRTHPPKIECTKEFVKIAIDYASKQKIRIDVIIWDLHDSRHKIVGRSDKENLERMYFHLLRNIVEKWQIFDCRFYPDENSEYEYNEIVDYLNQTKYPRKEPNIIKLFKEERIIFNFKEVKSQKSDEQHLIQLADLFAGFACFSRVKKDEYKVYKKQKENEDERQSSLFENLSIENKRETNLSKADINRFEIIQLIKDLCEKKTLGVSLNTNNYLKTYDPRIPVNFWHYEPQGDYDKAPTRQRDT